MGKIIPFRPEQRLLAISNNHQGGVRVALVPAKSRLEQLACPTFEDDAAAFKYARRLQRMFPKVFVVIVDERRAS